MITLWSPSVGLICKVKIIFCKYINGTVGEDLLRIYTAEDSASREDRISAGYYARFATKNSAKNKKKMISPIVQRLMTPKDRAINNMIGPKDKTADDK